MQEAWEEKLHLDIKLSESGGGCRAKIKLEHFMVNGRSLFGLCTSQFKTTVIRILSHTCISKLFFEFPGQVDRTQKCLQSIKSFLRILSLDIVYQELILADQVKGGHT